jgi:nicotinate-nucleotide adenylyltransferase
VHIGHQVIAGYMAEFTDLEEVWFVVSPHNPLKEKSSLLKDHHRLAMLRLAVEDSPHLKVSDIEFGLPSPSYTIHTLVHLEERHPDREFALIMGGDNLAGLKKWKKYELILERHDLYVYPRQTPYAGEFENHPRVRFINAPLMEISSSFIRDAVRSKKDVRYMLPAKVYDYMREMHFYEK